MTEEKKLPSRATIKVCVHKDCAFRGGEEVYQNLKEGLSQEEALVLKTDACFDYCNEGPNIVLNDNIVKDVRPFTAVEHVRAELENPSCKADGIGSRPLHELDDVLDSIEKL